MSEIILQAQCFQWAWNELPQTRKLLFHVPNGGSRNKVEAMSLKASGVIAGVPDLLFIWGSKVYAFELKSETGRLSEAQINLHPIWEKAGVKVHLIRSLEQFQNIIKQIVNHTT